MLRDESWEAASATFKAEALRTYRIRQRVNRLTRSAGSVVVLVVVFAGLTHWFSRPAPAPRQVAAALTAIPRAQERARQLTDQDLVAAFPKGSCFIAEVDGKKELIFLDPAVERTYVARAGVGGN